VADPAAEAASAASEADLSVLLGGAVAVAATAAAGLAWGLGEARAYTLRKVDVPVLPEGSRALRVLHISDVHVTPQQRRKLNWVRGLANQEPDLVVATGDFLSHAEAIAPVLSALGPLLDRPGVFVRGSNDYFSPKPLNPFRYFAGPSRLGARRTELPTGALTAGLVAGGWLDLDNTRGSLSVRGMDLSFVGVDDPHIGRDEMPAAGGDRGAVHIGVAHAPYRRVLDAFMADGAQLMLAGHTHGGQVCLPGWGALVTNCDLDTRRAKGLSGWPGDRPDAGDENSGWLHVSAGLGTSPYAPVRFACRPEATLLTLVPKRSAEA
jgi:predicted MPP superfamily phosphohydrolase